MTESVSFNEFEATDYQHWFAKLEKDLKGADAHAFLSKNSRKALDLKIIYEEASSPFSVNSSKKNIPEFFKANGWFIEHLILAKAGNEAQTNKEILVLLENGCSSLRIQVTETINWDALLEGVNLDLIEFSVEDFNEGFVSNQAIKNTSLLPHLLRDKYDSKSTEVETSFFANQGALPHQQIAIGLLQLDFLAQENPKKLRVNLASDSEVLLEIAKIRAFRYLAEKLLTALEKSTELRFAVEPLYLNYSHKEPEINLLRTASACYVGALSGCEIICAFPHYDDFSGYKTAQNAQILAQEESHLDEEYDSLRGSFFIENTSKEIAQKAWTLFLELKEKGNFDSLLSKGTINDLIKEAKTQHLKSYQDQSLVRVGSNKYLNEKENSLFPWYRYPQEIFKKSGVLTTFESIES